MRTALQFIKKEFLHILRDYRTLMVLFGMPLAQLIIFGYVVRTEIQDAEIAIYDKAKDEQSQKLVNKIISSGYFKLNKVITNESEFESSFEEGLVKEIIVIPENFAANLVREHKSDIQIIADASDPNVGRMLTTYTSSIIRDFQSELQLFSPVSASPVIAEVRMIYNKELKSVFMFVPGLIALILMLVSALMTSIAITREKENGSMEVLLVSPLKPAVIIIGKVIPYISIGIINATSVLVLAIYLFDIPFKGSYLLFFLESLLFILTALSLGITISTVAKTQQAALMISLGGLLMPTILLSGFIFPAENMPYILQLLSHIMPAKWFLVIIKSIMLQGNGIEFIWKETLILAGMALLFIAISIRKFNIRLE